MSRRTLKPGWWSLALLASCASLTPAEKTEEPTPVEAQNPDTPEPPPAAPADPVIPSVLETQRALEASGIQTTLADLIPTDRPMDLTVGDPDRAAVRTGVVVADMLLTASSSEKDQLVGQLDAIATGMSQLKGGADIQKTIEDLKERVKADAVPREKLVEELDELSGVVIPELKFEGEARVVPLIQAGSWVEGTYLVASALKSSESRESAESLLKAPAVVDYFMKYVEIEGSEKAPEPVTTMLKSSLTTLKGLAEKTEPLTDEELDTVIKVTKDVMWLL